MTPEEVSDLNVAATAFASELGVPLSGPYLGARSTTMALRTCWLTLFLVMEEGAIFSRTIPGDLVCAEDYNLSDLFRKTNKAYNARLVLGNVLSGNTQAVIRWWNHVRDLDKYGFKPGAEGTLRYIQDQVPCEQVPYCRDYK